MWITELINLILQNGFMLVFSAMTLYLLLKVSNIYIEKLKWKKEEPILPDSLVVNIVRAIVWYHSKWKLRYIESVLLANHIDTRQKEITKKIRNALEWRAQVYLDYLNTLSTNIPKLWDFYGNAFDMIPFFDEVMKITLSPYNSKDHATEIVLKLKDIGEIMTEYQDKAAEKVEDELKRLSQT